MLISEINYERKYAYAEVEAIINYMGEEYKNKIPNDVLKIIQKEKRQDYVPNFDFSKPLVPQVTRQETINLIAYLYITYWCDNEEDKKKILAQIEMNKEKENEIAHRKRLEEIRLKAVQGKPQSIDEALKSKFKK